MTQTQPTPDPALQAAALQSAGRLVAAAFERGDTRTFDEGVLARHVATLARRLTEFRQQALAGLK